MNVFRVIALVASLAFTSAQLTTGIGSSNSLGNASPSLGAGATGMSGPLDAMNPANNPMGTGTPGLPGQTGMNGMNGMAGMNSMGLNNPLMMSAMMGGDNLRRAFMAPMFGRMGMGTVPQMMYMRKGMEGMMKTAGADMFARMMTQSGMPPMLSTMMAGNMMDAPDMYTMMNLLMNPQGMGGGNAMGGNAMGSQAQGGLSGAAQNPMGGNQQSNSLFSNPMALMAMSGAF